MSLCQSSGEEEGWNNDLLPRAPVLLHNLLHRWLGSTAHPALLLALAFRDQTGVLCLPIPIDSAELQVTSH